MHGCTVYVIRVYTLFIKMADNFTHIHIHTHTHTYIYIYIYTVYTVYIFYLS